jgi:hypothetical protein
MKMGTGVCCFVAILGVAACSDNSSQTPQFGTTSGAATGGTTGSAGGSGNATSMTGSTSASGMSSGAASSGSNASSGSGGSGASTGASSGSAGTGASDAGAGGDATVGGTDPITKVVPTAGCGMNPGTVGTPGMTVMGTIATTGTKPTGCADSACGPWMYTRQYFVTLPTGYVNTKAYPLVLEGPGCGGNGGPGAVYPLTNPTANVNNTVIRVGLTPPPNAIGHATNPGQGCFDDKEGDSSVDWVFYENLYDKLAAVLCFDKNRVFSAGNSSGAWFSNELGCKYAGDPTRPVRGIMPNTGGLPTDPRYVPTCTTKGMAGMWIHEVGDTTNPFTGNKVAIARAMKVNGCTIGTGYDDTMFDPYPIGGGNPDGTCKKIRGCPDLYPLVVCPLPGNAHASHDNVANPGFSTFITLFSTPPLLTP